MRIDHTPSNQPTTAPKNIPKIDRQFSAFIAAAQSTKKIDQGLKVSHHAQQRMSERGMTLEERDWNTIHSAVAELKEKGSKNSLLIYKDMALIASIHNRTIITALEQDEVDTITNIDSMKFIKEQ